MGTWASAVTTAVAPLCWESKTFLTTVSGADSITLLPHQGYLIRTQPNNHLQAQKHAEFMRVDWRQARLLPVASRRRSRCRRRSGSTDVLPKGGSELVGALIYEKDKTTYRSEVDQALQHQAGLHLPQRLCARRHRAAARPVPRRLRRRAHDAVLCAHQKLLEIAAARGDRRRLHRRSPRPTSTRPPSRWPPSGPASTDPDSYETQATDWISLVLPHHRQGQGGDRHGAARQRAQDLAGLGAEGLHAPSRG